MPSTGQPIILGSHFARDLWRLTRVYWSSPDAAKGGLLLALCVALELGTVYGNVRIAVAQSHVFNAVQDKQWPAFLTAIEWFLGIALVVVLVSTYRIYAATSCRCAGASTRWDGMAPHSPPPRRPWAALPCPPSRRSCAPPAAAGAAATRKAAVEFQVRVSGTFCGASDFLLS